MLRTKIRQFLSKYIILIIVASIGWKYLDDIIFGSSKDELCIDFVNEMQKEFEISMIGELLYLIGL